MIKTQTLVGLVAQRALKTMCFQAAIYRLKSVRVVAQWMDRYLLLKTMAILSKMI